MVKKLFLFTVLAFVVFLSACGGGGGSTSSTFSLAITDAKPVLPPGVVAVNVTIDEVSVHQSGGDWISLPLAQTPFTINLLQFTDGNTTQLVPQTTLTSGMYTQVRLGVQSAEVVTDTDQHFTVDIASGDLKTDKNFDFNVADGGGVALTVDFDLSQSLVVTGGPNPVYKLKPVLHLVNASEAATIGGSIATATFGAETQATIIVTQGGVEYTRLVVDLGATDPTPFLIYWLVPDQSYTVEVWVGGVMVYSELVEGTNLPAGAVYSLNSGTPIPPPT
jgi:hypothetical protein